MEFTIEIDNNEPSGTTLDTNVMSSSYVQLNQLSPLVIGDRDCRSSSSYELQRPKSMNTMTPMRFDNEMKSNNPYSNLKHKRHSRARSQSVQPHSHKYELLKKKYKHQESKLQMYQDKITDIQDNAEETEAQIRKKYELKLLHLETKYLKEKSEKGSLQLQIEKLKQELYTKQCENDHIKNVHAASGYSTISTSTTNTTPTPHHPPHFAHQMSTESVVIHQDHNTSGIMGVPTTQFGSPVEQHHYGFSPTGHSLISRSSVGSSTSGESSDSESDPSDEAESNTETDSRTDSSDSDSSSSDKSSSEEQFHNSIKQKKKILTKDIQKRQPKGFWATIWSLFGPPDIVCSCSDETS